MAHKVTFSLPERELGGADIEFLAGKMPASLGSSWYQKGHSLAEEMEVQARKEARVGALRRAHAQARSKRARLKTTLRGV